MQFIGYIIVETPKSFLFHDHFWHEPEFIPKSQSTVVRPYDTDEVQIRLTEWICKQNGFREFEERKNGK